MVLGGDCGHIAHGRQGYSDPNTVSESQPQFPSHLNMNRLPLSKTFSPKQIVAGSRHRTPPLLMAWIV